MNNLIDHLKQRDFIQDETTEGLKEALAKPIRVYCGFDPTADSLHLGNLVGIMGLAWFKRFGHTPVAIVGGATGMIGDPSGKTSERQLLSEEVIDKNIIGIKKNLEAVLGGGGEPLLLLNNYDWYHDFSILNFLRDVGKFFRVGPMLGKESVRARMESEEGMSFTEFSYQLLQGYDFLHLYREFDVSMQIGGSDQWGNITAGVELIRKVLSKSAFGLTFPLLVKSDGQKFGKSEKGAIWLSKEKLSPYEFYQHLFRTQDADVIKCLKMLTFLPIDEIRSIERSMKEAGYVPNTAQKKLAEQVTEIVHGKEALQVALRATNAAAPGSKAELDLDTLLDVAKDLPAFEIAKERLIGLKLIDLMADAKLLPSKSEARRMVKNGGVYLNNERIDEEDFKIEPSHLIGGRLLLLASGKKNKMVIHAVSKTS